MIMRNKWIIIRNAFRYRDFRYSIKDFKVDSIIGYIYADTDAGLSMQTEFYFVNNVWKKLDTIIIIRYNSYKEMEVEVLTDEECQRIALLDKPAWLEIYENDALKKLRDDEVLNSYRHNYYIDDVKCLIITDKAGEIVWVRVTEKVNGQYKGKLLNQPIYSNYKKGDQVYLKPDKVNHKDFLILIDRNQSSQK
jgi:hypothetical protein